MVSLSYNCLEKMACRIVRRSVSFNFNQRVALVTGAGGGLGKEYALELGRRGATVIVNDIGGSVEGQGRFLIRESTRSK